MIHIPKQKRQKWDSKSEELIFVGYNENSKTYRCIHPVTKYFSRDVNFFENISNKNSNINYAKEVNYPSNDQDYIKEEKLSLLKETILEEDS